MQYLTSEMLLYMMKIFVLYKLGLYNVNNPGQNDRWVAMSDICILCQLYMTG